MNYRPSGDKMTLEPLSIKVSVTLSPKITPNDNIHFTLANISLTHLYHYLLQAIYCIQNTNKIISIYAKNKTDKITQVHNQIHKV